jgi:hypothetical protein
VLGSVQARSAAGKTRCGELGTDVTAFLNAKFWPSMPAGNELRLRAPWNFFVRNSLLRRFPHHLLRSFSVLLGAVLLHRRRKLHPSGVTPSEALPTPLEAGKIAAAGGAAVGRGPDSQKKRCPLRWTIVLFAPCRELLTVATRTPREFPRALGPYTGLPACAAARAAQGINAEDAAQNIGYRSPMRYARFATPAFGASKLHS